jgi:hypothetical protein
MYSPIDKIDDLKAENRLQDAINEHSKRCATLNKSINVGKLCIKRIKNKIQKKQKHV